MKPRAKKFVIVTVLACVVCALFSLIFITHTVAATNTINAPLDVKSRIINKTYLQGVYKCYTLAKKKDSSTKQIADTVNGEDAKYWSSMFPDVSASDEYSVGLPTGWVEMAKSMQSSTSCYYLSSGKATRGTNVLRGMTDILDVDVEKGNANSLAKFYEGMGYNVQRGDKQNCVTLAFKIFPMGDNQEERKGSVATNKVCFNLKEDGRTLAGNYDKNNSMNCQERAACIIETGEGTYQLNICLAKAEASPSCALYTEKNLPIFQKFNDDSGIAAFVIGSHDTTIGYPITIQFWEGLDFEEDVLGAFRTFMGYFASTEEESFYAPQGDPRSPGSDTDTWLAYADSKGEKKDGIIVSDDGVDIRNTEYTLGDVPTARTKMVNFLTGSTKNDDDRIALTDSEAVFLYQHYIRDIAQANIFCDLTEQPEGGMAVKWFRTADKRENCYAVILHPNVAVNTLIKTTASVIGSNDEPVTNTLATSSSATAGWWITTTQINILDIAEQLNNINISKLVDVADQDIYDMADNPNRVEDDDDRYVEPSCYQNAQGVGIALCPIIQAGTSFFQGFYKDHIVPFLQTNPVLLSNSRLKQTDKRRMAAESTQAAWGFFQGFANILFIGVFLFVIFSQITGVGLDNYGIKKILPKLIVGAILINLSYFICQIAVDVANIVGNAMEGIFKNIGTLDSFMMAADGMGNSSPWKAVAGFSLFVGIIIVIGAGAWLMLGPAVLLPIFAAVISGLVAYIGLYVMLALRTALTIMLVVFSPLAFLCYMLDGTKSIFKKWLSTFKAVLLAFPICSIMIYGGEAAGRIMLLAMGAAQPGVRIGLSEALAAAIISIGPIFMIPSTLKKSLGALGGIADRVTHAARNRATGALNNSGYADSLRRRRELHRAGLEEGDDGELKVSRIGLWQDGLKIGKDGKIKKRRFAREGSRYAQKRRNDRRINAAKEYYEAGSANDYLGSEANDNLRRLKNTYVEQENKKRIKAYESDIRMGDYMVGDAKIEANDINSLENALVDAIRKKNADAAKALQNMLKDKGIDGIDATHSAIKRAEAEATAAGDMDGFYETMESVAKNALNNYPQAYSTTDLSMRDMMEGYAKKEKLPTSHYEESFSMSDLSLENVNESSHGMQLMILKRMETMPKEDQEIIAKRLIKMRGRARRKGVGFDGYQEKLVSYAYKMSKSKTGLTDADRADINATFNSENKFQNI